jgi:ABC-type transport system involved in multi-copper enzyme maturation permease subunit
MMNWVSGSLVVWRHAFGRCLRGGRLIALLLLVAVPLVITAASMAHRSPEGALEVFLDTFVLGVLGLTVPFAALLLGVAVLGDEIEGRTITYLFTRPLPRPVFYLGRLKGFTAAFSLVLALTVLAMAALCGEGASLSTSEIGGCVLIAAAGFVVYAAFFAALRTLVRRALFVGFLLTFMLEVWISKMPVGNLARWTLWHHLTVLVTRLFDGRAVRFEAMEQVAADETALGSSLVLAGVLLVSLVVGAWVVRAREVRVPAAVS